MIWERVLSWSFSLKQRPLYKGTEGRGPRRDAVTGEDAAQLSGGWSSVALQGMPGCPPGTGAASSRSSAKRDGGSQWLSQATLCRLVPGVGRAAPELGSSSVTRASSWSAAPAALARFGFFQRAGGFAVSQQESGHISHRLFPGHVPMGAPAKHPPCLQGPSNPAVREGRSGRLWPAQTASFPSQNVTRDQVSSLPKVRICPIRGFFLIPSAPSLLREGN